MIVTHDIAEAMYNCLKAMKPFSRWNLPDSDMIGFVVNGSKANMGAHNFHTDAHHIYLSQINVVYFDDLATTMAHEMVHAKQLMDGKRRTHGKLFMQLAAQVCAEMGWHMRQIR